MNTNSGVVNPHGIKVGQSVYYVPSRHYYGQPRMVVVSKVGRKWAETNNSPRINISTLEADAGGFTSPGRFYLSEEEHSSYQKRCSVWSAIQKKVGAYSLPAHSLETMEEVARLIGVKL